MRKPDRLGVQVLKDEIFRGDIYLVAGPIKMFTLWIRKRYDEPTFAMVHSGSLGRVVYHEWAGGGREWVVHFPTVTPLATSVVHECVHVALDVLGHRGIVLGKSGDADEAVAYYVEAMFRQITTVLARWQKQGRR